MIMYEENIVRETTDMGFNTRDQKFNFLESTLAIVAIWEVSPRVYLDPIFFRIILHSCQSLPRFSLVFFQNNLCVFEILMYTCGTLLVIKSLVLIIYPSLFIIICYNKFFIPSHKVAFTNFSIDMFLKAHEAVELEKAYTP